LPKSNPLPKFNQICSNLTYFVSRIPISYETGQFYNRIAFECGNGLVWSSASQFET